MSPKVEKRLLAVWVALSAITVLSWWIGSQRGHNAFAMNSAITFAVLGIAAVKMRVIIREFMEVRHAPALLRRLTDAWLAVLFVTLLGIYALGLGIRD